MRRLPVKCGLCGALVKLTKSGKLPDHLRREIYGRSFARCNGISEGIHIGLAARAAPVAHQWKRQAHIRARRFHESGKSLERDRAQRHRWLYRNGWLPAQLARRYDQVYPWSYQIKYGQHYAG
jgi:hypothetical protein